MDGYSEADAKRTLSYSLDLHFLGNIRHFSDLHKKPRFVAMEAFKKSLADLGPGFARNRKISQNGYRTEVCTET